MKFNKNKILIACLSLFMATQTQAANDTKEQKSIEGIYQVNFNKEINVLSTILIDKENLYVNADILSDLAFSKFNFDDNIRVLNDKKYIYIPLSLVKKIDDNEMTLSILLDDRFFDKKNSITKEFNYKNRYYRLIDNENIVNYFNNNYQLNYDNQEKLSAYLETNYSNKNFWSVQNKLIYRKDKLNRIKTFYKKEFEDKSALQVGDVVEDSFSQLASVNGLGFKYATNYFNNNTNFNVLESLPQYSVNGFSLTPSLFNLYSNSNTILSDEISSGNYNLIMPFKQGYGIYNGYIKDYLGNVQQFNIPYYNTNKLLKEKGFEYSVSGASLRKNLYDSSFEYSKPFVSGIAKYGINKQVTQDFGFHTSSYFKNIYTASNFYIQPQWGLFQAGLNINSDNEKLYNLSWEFVSNASYVVKLSTMVSNDKNGFCINYINDCIKKQNRFLVGYTLPNRLGQIAFQSLNENKLNTKFVNNSVSWSKSFDRKTNLTVIYEQTKNDVTNANLYKNNKLMVFLVHSFDDRISGNINYQNNSNYNATQARLSISEDKSNPEYGYGYINVTNTSIQNSPSYNVNYYANLKHFSYNIQANSGQNYSYNRAGIKGAMLYLPEDNQFLFNRMTNGVILVDTDQKENEDNSGLEVLHQNKMSGFTNNNGQYTIVNAIPYSKEKIELNLKTLPLDKNFEVFKKEIIVPYYGAAKVKFNQILPDSIITVKNLPFGAIFKIKDDSFIVGKDGETSVNQVGLATFETDGLKCSFNVSVNQKEYECK